MSSTTAFMTETMTHVRPLLVKRRICMELHETMIPVGKLTTYSNFTYRTGGNIFKQFDSMKITLWNVINNDSIVISK